MEFDGLDALQRLLIQGGAEAAKAAEQGIYQEAQVAFGDSQVEVPVDTGALRASGQVHPPRTEGSWIIVEITYGGAASAYAEIVHEDLTAAHAAPTKAKYLETPVMRRVATLGQNIAARVEQNLRSIR